MQLHRGLVHRRVANGERDIARRAGWLSTQGTGDADADYWLGLAGLRGRWTELRRSPPRAPSSARRMKGSRRPARPGSIRGGSAAAARLWARAPSAGDGAPNGTTTGWPRLTPG